MRHVIVLALLVTACKKAPPASDAAPATPATGSATPAGAAGSSGTTPTPTPTAAGAETAEPAKVTECPKSLDGSERVHRVITKACGRVTVAGDYNLDGGSLTLEAGSVLQFKPDTSLNIGYNGPAKLIVTGTAAEPVLFTSGADAAAGVWEGVYLHDGADRSAIDGLVVEFAGKEGGQAVKIVAEDVVWKGSTIRDSKGYGMLVEQQGRVTDLSNNTFDRTVAAPLMVGPEAVAGIGAGNKLPAGAVIEVAEGKIDQAVVWNPGVPVHVVGSVVIEGEKVRASLEIAAGSEVRFGPEGRFSIGYNHAGAIKTSGTKEAPVLFTTASQKEPGSWSTIGVFQKGEASFDFTIFEYGGAEEKGVVASQGKTAVRNCIFRQNGGGLQLEDREAALLALEGTRFEKNKGYALTLHPDLLGALGAGNVYDDRARIRVIGGRVGTSMTWKTQDTTIEISDDVAVEAKNTLTLEPGARLEFAEGANINAGYNDHGTLRFAGSGDKPIQLAGIRREPGSWEGIILYDGARDVVFEHVLLRDAGTGVTIKGNAVAKLTSVTCAGCSEATVAWECASKVTTKDVKAASGTPKGELKPTCN